MCSISACVDLQMLLTLLISSNYLFFAKQAAQIVTVIFQKGTVQYMIVCYREKFERPHAELKSCIPSVCT